MAVPSRARETSGRASAAYEVISRREELTKGCCSISLGSICGAAAATAATACPRPRIGLRLPHFGGRVRDEIEEIEWAPHARGGGCRK
ncbi:uncharacterized protein MICPUCDRAFT_64188 [Micromonas pusilla CCMP1545]|jgi:hypothetical protein|uniref:Predicted protein n=1 Tax=Micromonas pusilla (strain CCMP1545) TaxID=564608 RepID=C1MK30_MICPC|nr:uncharacterized protein MICPUCDRAFT_64188 [Micromonas pusilla CCMP1545]EEH59296.1 predicted protein [Micromonas pusilla CCMP1545]|eukprot:XP_003055920.1 predicted protein [Micromonas pusilla CCMP1545]